MTGWALWRLPPLLRWYVVTVISASVLAAATIAATTDWRVAHVGLFVALVCFGAAAIELTRRTTENAGLIKDVHGIWQLPIALLLPPVYCLAAPAVTFVMLQTRNRRTIAHRRFFSISASGLALTAASAVFHWLRSGLGLWAVPQGRQATVWLLAAVAAGLVWSLCSKLLIMTAIRAADPTVNVREQLLRREALVNDTCEICAGLLLASAVGGVSVVLLLPALPLVIVLQRSFRHAQLLSEARIDGKTGLLNAAAWRAEAEVALAQAERTRAPVAVAIADLDHFKAINDGYGHLTGDAVLAATAASFQSSLRPYDLLGRFGGEEFAILLPGADSERAMEAAERLRATLAAIPVAHDPAHGELHVTVSVGVAAATDLTGADLTELLAAADTALYAAKNAGRNATRLAMFPGQAFPAALHSH